MRRALTILALACASCGAKQPACVEPVPLYEPSPTVVIIQLTPEGSSRVTSMECVFTRRLTPDSFTATCAPETPPLSTQDSSHFEIGIADPESFWPIKIHHVPSALGITEQPSIFICHENVKESTLCIEQDH